MYQRCLLYLSLFLSQVCTAQTGLSESNLSNEFNLNKMLPGSGAITNGNIPGLKKQEYISTNNFLSYDVLFPKLKKDWKSDPWVGINAQMSFFRAGYATGNGIKTDSLGTRKGQGYMAFIGIFYNHPLHIARNVITVEPEIGLDFNLGRFRDNPNSNPMGMGFRLSPGLGIKIGPAKVVARYDLGFFVNLFDRSNALSGGMAYPVLSAQFETGWGLMNPRAIQSRGLLITSQTTEEFDHLEAGVPGQYWAVYKYTTTYQEHSIKSLVYDIGPFWYISPKITSSFAISRDNRNTLQFGGALGGRVGIFGIEAYTTTGTHGFGAQIHPLETKNYFGELKDHTGYTRATTVGASAGFDLFALLTKIFVHNHEDRAIYSATRFNRLLFTGGYGWTFFSGTPVYNSTSAIQEIDNLSQVMPSLAPDQAHTPGAIQKSTFLSSGFRIEMGLVSVGFEKYFYDQAKFANGTVFVFQYFIPPGRLMRASKKLIEIKQEISN